MGFDFETDLKREIHTAFVDYGIKLPIRSTLNECLMDYLTINKKLISAKIRTVKYNPQFLNELPEHPKKKEIDFIAKLFSSGKDVNFFQNKRLFQSNFHDHLVYEWNIYHLHLSLAKERKHNFAKQVNQLLFVYINDDCAIFLGSDSHSSGLFGNVKWLEILHDHFPEIIEPFRHHETNKVFPEVNGLERQTLWDKGYTLMMTPVRDKVYINTGIGRTTSGHSLEVGKTTDSIIRWIFTLRKQFEVHGDNICRFLGVKLVDSKFRLRIGPQTLEIIETHSNRLVLSYPEIVNENIFEF